MVCGGMAILYVAAAFVFFMWWVRGSIWPALPLPILLVLIEYVSCKDQGHPDPPGALIFLVAIGAASFIPYAVKRHRARRFDRMLNGVTFLGKD